MLVPRVNLYRFHCRLIRLSMLAFILSFSFVDIYIYVCVFLANLPNQLLSSALCHLILLIYYFWLVYSSIKFTLLFIIYNGLLFFSFLFQFTTSQVLLCLFWFGSHLCMCERCCVVFFFFSTYCYLIDIFCYYFFFLLCCYFIISSLNFLQFY